MGLASIIAILMKTRLFIQLRRYCQSQGLQRNMFINRKYRRYRSSTIKAMKEAKRIQYDPNIKGFTNMADLISELEK